MQSTPSAIGPAYPSPMRFLVQLLAAIVACGTAAAVRAQDRTQGEDWPRFHFGVAVGHSDLGLATSDAGVPESIWSNSSVEFGTASKVVAGFRPIRVVGVEIQLVDLGGGDNIRAYAGAPYGVPMARTFEQEIFGKTNAKANVLSALLFIPEPLSRFDVYGKVGVADLDASLDLTAIRRGVTCPTVFCSFSGQFDESHTGPYVGFGARFRVGRTWAARAEYEAIDRDIGENTTMLSVGIAWER